MKSLFVILFALFFLSLKPPFKTQKFGGSYAYGKDIEKGRVGFIDVFPETDSTILFYLDLNRGAPSYNMGQLYGRIKIVNNSGVFYLANDGKGCKFKLTFSKRLLFIKTIDEQWQCPFGGGVYADGTFKKFSNKVPTCFIGPTGEDTVYFRTTPPEEYNKE